MISSKRRIPLYKFFSETYGTYRGKMAMFSVGNVIIKRAIAKPKSHHISILVDSTSVGALTFEKPLSSTKE